MVPSLWGLALILPLVLSLFLSSFTDATTNGFTVDMIHRDSIKSPLYTSTHNDHDRLYASIRRSHSRYNAHHEKILSQSGKSNPSFEFGLVATAYEYLMTIHLGTPSRNVVAIADTGSDVIWTNCVPYHKCYKQDAPLFNPKNSSTYHGLNCNSHSCRLLSSSNCTKDIEKCNYIISYGDGSRVEGLLANENFHLRTSEGREKLVKHVLSFGCSYMSQGVFDPHMAGIVGLGGGPLSLVSQLGPLIGHKFSYCLARYNEKNVTSKLNFGSKAIISGPNTQSTPLITNPLFPPTYYVVELSGIKVRDMELKIKNSNIIIDSGTTLSYLDPEMVRSVVQELTKAIHLPRVKDPDLNLCFNVSGNTGIMDQFPDVVLNLGTAKMRLGPKNAFILLEDKKACLAIVEGEPKFQLLGNIAQQDFHVGYDLADKKVFFTPTNCAKFQRL